MLHFPSETQRRDCFAKGPLLKNLKGVIICWQLSCPRLSYQRHKHTGAKTESRLTKLKMNERRKKINESEVLVKICSTRKEWWDWVGGENYPVLAEKRERRRRREFVDFSNWGSGQADRYYYLKGHRQKTPKNSQWHPIRSETPLTVLQEPHSSSSMEKLREKKEW